MYIWNELSLPVGKKEAYYKMVGGKSGKFFSAGTNDMNLYIPLEFWFCRNIGLALPLIGLQYHEVKIVIQFEESSNILFDSDPSAKPSLSGSLWIDYVYLDTDERRKFAQSSHEYLIEQLQFTGKESAENKIKLNFNHPVKELVWVMHNKDTKNEEWMNYTNDADVLSPSSNYLNTNPHDISYKNMSALLGPAGDTKNPIKKAKLILNGNDRFYARDGRYFNLIQPFQHHENVPNNTGINVYSFALKPEEHQPSGTLNMSRIDTAVLDLEYESQDSAHQLSVFAINYNVLRILSGMGGIAYSN
jgi:hypothetical protein